MGLKESLEMVREFIASDMDGFDLNNVAVGKEDPFLYIERMPNPGYVKRCAIVDYAGFKTADKTEFRSLTIHWNVSVMFFTMRKGPDDTEALEAGYDLVYNFLSACAVNPTFGDAVLLARPDVGGSTEEISRGNYEYFGFPLIVTVWENIS
jgi:hypothetical protein